VIFSHVIVSFILLSYFLKTSDPEVDDLEQLHEADPDDEILRRRLEATEPVNQESEAVLADPRPGDP
jgi:hypothetical protein